MNPSTHGRAELCLLSESLAGSVRWRLRDYEALLKAQFEILAASGEPIGPGCQPVAGKPGGHGTGALDN